MAKIISWTYKEKKEAFANQKKSLRLKERNPYYLSNEEETEMNKILKQAEAEVVPSQSSVQFKLESDSVGLRFIKFISD